MSAKTAALFTLLTLAANVAAQNNGTPPACMIAAVNTQKDPSAVKSICQTQDVTDYINNKCGDNRDAAMKYFAGVCKNVDVEISTAKSTTNNTSSNNGGSASASPSSSGSASNTASGAAGSSSPAKGGAPMVRLGMDVLGLSILGGLGAMLAL